MGFIQGDPAAILIVEYAGDTAEARCAPRWRRWRRGASASASATPPAWPSTPASRGRSGSSARRGSGCSSASTVTRKPLAFVEDTAVHPKDLAKFVARFREIFARHETDGAYYGHCSVGCLHIRPGHQLKTARGSSRSGGSPTRSPIWCWSSAARSPASTATAAPAARSSSACTGPTIMRAFRELKRAFDPERPPEPRQHRGRSPAITENLRYGAGYTTWEPRDAARFLEAGRLRRGGGDVQRRGRVPQDAGGHDVPVVHGHARRGALDPRAAPTRCAPCCRARCPPASSRAGGCTRSWTCAWSARAARPSARPTWTWPS